MATRFEFAPDELVLEEVTTLTTAYREIVLHNDDVNTFDHVILSLMEVCEHDPIQAEQCAWIVHNNGKCSVKRGAYEDLEARCDALQIRGLAAEIQ